MDPTQWPPAVLGVALGAVVASVVGLLGVLLGARINARATRLVAEEARRTQLALAREAARREWRRPQMVDLLDQINQRTTLCTHILLELNRGRQQDAQSLMERLPHHQLPAADLRWEALASTPLGPLALRYIEADNALMDALGTPETTSDQRAAALARVVQIAGQINQEAERYIVGD